ncbi:methyltransferase domain-containing protein [Clostridium tertium]|uniref:Putative methyltransferase YcgJ n=1 Tax=Clostridium tertium TaxID=1559 RepID=A0A6N2YIF7_9CLOT
MSYNEILKGLSFDKEVERLEKQALLGVNKELKVLKSLGVQENSLILEVGSGPGIYTQIILDKFKNSEVVSLDNNQEALEYAYKNLHENYKERVSFINDNIMRSSLPDNYFDVVIARFVFQHLSYPEKALKEIYRVLKPGGKVIIIDVDSGLWGLTYPDNKLINNLNNQLSAFQSNNNGNREIGRVILTMLKLLKFKNIDIEAIINHSDVLGKDNFRHNFDIEKVKDKSLYSMMKSYNDFFDLKYSSIMILKLVFYGEK